MRSAERLLQIIPIWLMLGIAGCAGTLTSPTQPPVPAAARAPAPPVSAAVQREFAGALRAMKLGHFPEAERALRELTRTHPDLSGPYANLGIVDFRMGRLPEAVEALKRATDINPACAACFNQLGVVYRESGQFDNAREAYDKALRIDPNYAAAQLNLGILYDLYLQDFNKALQYYERYQALTSPEDAQVAKWIIDLKHRNQVAAKTARSSNE
jgi:tetratricopeptide (TPR) repeat protein